MAMGIDNINIDPIIRALMSTVQSLTIAVNPCQIKSINNNNSNSNSAYVLPLSHPKKEYFWRTTMAVLNAAESMLGTMPKIAAEIEPAVSPEANLSIILLSRAIPRLTSREMLPATRCSPGPSC
jgi:hypothetical protein